MQSRRNFQSGWVLMVLVLLALALSTQQETLAQGEKQNTWARPVPISGALPGSWYPSVTAQDDGAAYAVWTVTQNNQNTIYFSQRTAVAWTRPIDILIGGGHVDLRLDGRNSLHLVYGNEGAVYVSDATTDKASTAQGWNKPLKLSRQNGVLGDFLTAPDGALNSVWAEQNEKTSTTAQAVFGQSNDGGQSWTVYRVIGDRVSETTRIRLTPSAGGTLYALWGIPPAERNQDGIALNISKNNGNTWLDTPRTFGSPDAPVRQPVLAVDKNRALVLVYNFGVKDETFYQVSTDEGATWSDQKPVPSLFAANPATGNDYFAIANDIDGRVHLIAVGRKSKDQTSPGVYHLSWDGDKWSAPEELYQGNTFVEFPDIAISNGNRLHVVFSTRDRSRVSGPPDSSSQVWYTSADIQATTVTRVPLPTLAPRATETQTIVQTAGPTRRATRTPSAIATPSDVEPPRPANLQLPILMGVIPVVILLAVVVVLNRVLRRRR